MTGEYKGSVNLVADESSTAFSAVQHREEGLASKVEAIIEELVIAGGLDQKPGFVLVIGTSTSEVMGARIGTSGTIDIARELFDGVERARSRYGFFPAFQCCEHLNRALVVSRELLGRKPFLEPVTVVPVPQAGGSMAAYAYRTLREPVVVEAIQADAGIDIGGTMIGMHLKPVAVPVRPTIRNLGQAVVQMAYSRPKLIGGARAVYRMEEEDGTCS